MATKSKLVSQSDGPQKKPLNPFVNYDLTQDDKQRLKKLAPKAEEVNSVLVALVREGYKVSVSWDDYSNCVQCFLIAHAESLPNHPYILTARANDLSKALASLVYKHTNVFAGVWHDRIMEGRPQDDF